MKKFLYAFIAVILLLVTVPSFIDWSHFKAPIITAVKENTGFEIDLKGSVRLSLLPSPHLDAHDVSIKNKSGGKAISLVELKSISLGVNVFPLLKGNVEVSKVELIEPVINLETFKNGENNWDVKADKASLDAKLPATDSISITKSDAKTPGFSLQKVVIKDGQVTISNFQTDSHHEIKNINLQGSLGSLTGPFFVNGQFNLNEYSLKVDAQTGAIESHDPSPVSIILSASKGKDDYGTLQIKGTVHDKKFAGSVQSSSLKVPFVLDLANKKLDLQQGIKFSARVEAEPENIKVSNLEVQLSSIEIAGNAVYKSSQVETKLIITESAAKLDVSAKGESNDKNLWDGTLAVQSDKPQAFLKWFGVDDNVSYLQGAFNISTHLKVEGEVYSLSTLKFKVGLLDGSGTASIRLSEDHPYVNADLSLNKLDLNAFMSADQKTSKSQETQIPAVNSNVAVPMRWSKDKWNLESLKAVNTDFKFNIGEVKYDEYQLSQVSGALHLKDGNLQLSSFQAQGYNGRLSGDAKVHQGKTPAVGLNFNIQNVNLTSLPKIRQTPLKKATLNTVLKLSATGDNTFDAVNSLSGNIQLNLGQGVIEAFDIKKFVADIKQVKSPADIKTLMDDLKRKADVSFTHLKADFTIQNGKANSQDIEFLSDDATVTGKGMIDLPGWVIDMNTQIKIKELGKLPPFGLKVAGTLDSPSYAIDQALLARVIFQEAANRVLDKAVGSIGGRVGDVLQSVLGGGKGKEEKRSDSSQQQPQPQQKQESSIKPEKILKDLLGGRF
jgi:uncharacterized protein involved in outer membrane biogenesis